MEFRLVAFSHGSAARLSLHPSPGTIAGQLAEVAHFAEVLAAKLLCNWGEHRYTLELPSAAWLSAARRSNGSSCKLVALRLQFGSETDIDAMLWKLIKLFKINN